MYYPTDLNRSGFLNFEYCILNLEKCWMLLMAHGLSAHSSYISIDNDHDMVIFGDDNASLEPFAETMAH